MPEEHQPGRRGSVPLEIAWTGRFVTAMWLLTAGAFWVSLVAVVVVAGTTAAEADDAERADILVAALVGGILVAAAGFSATRTAVRRLRRRPAMLTVSGDTVVVDVPALLERRLVREADDIAVAMVDDTTPPRWWDEVRRFPLGADLGWEPVWLFTSPRGARLPQLGYPWDFPDIALLFRDDVELPEGRRPSWLWRWTIGVHHYLHHPEVPASARGLLLKSADGARARAVLESAGMLRDPRSVDPVASSVATASELRPRRSPDSDPYTTPVRQTLPRVVLGSTLIAVTVVVVVLFVRATL